MKRRLAFVAVSVVALVAVFGLGTVQAAKPPLELAGQPFYFTAHCTDVGNVILVNQSLAHGSLRGVGTNVVVVPRFHDNSARINGTCTFTGGGFTVGTIEPFDEPFTLSVLIVNA